MPACGVHTVISSEWFLKNSELYIAHGPGAWAGSVGWRRGPGAWAGSVGRERGPGAWAGAVGRERGPGAWVGNWQDI
jgi:hypothetical protein